MRIDKRDSRVGHTPTPSRSGGKGSVLNDNRSAKTIQKKAHEHGCSCPGCTGSIQSGVLQAKSRKGKINANRIVKSASSARMAYTQQSGIALASMNMIGVMPDGSKTNLAMAQGHSSESSNRSDISNLLSVLPSKGNKVDGGKRWNDAEINALAKLDYKLYDVDPSSYQSFIFSVSTSIPMCKYCRRRLNYWKNRLQGSWGKPIQTSYTI